MAGQVVQSSHDAMHSLNDMEILKDLKDFQSQYIFASPWAAPPTPQDSEASDSTPPSPTAARLFPPCTPQKPEATPSSSPHTVGTAEARAPQAFKNGRLPTPEQTPPSARCDNISSDSSASRGREVRMQQWLTDIPPPVSPQERYLQGLNPKVDHPLHPHPLQVPASFQARLDNDHDEMHDEKLPHLQYLSIDEEDKENGDPESLLMDKNGLDEQDQLAASKKRSIPEGHSPMARKRTKILDPVRRFSQRVAWSLALNPAIAEVTNTRRFSDCVSPEDAARQSERPYRFNPPNKQALQPNRNGLRQSFSRRTSSLRVSSTSALRRVMQKNPGPVAHNTISLGPGDRGRPDMIVNVAFIGDAHVGKSALIRRLVDGTFPQSYVPSDITEQSLQLTVNNVRVQFNLSEAGSARDCRQPSLLALGWFSIVVLCFDIGRQSTLESLKKYRNEIAMYEENSIVVLAGLKKDARHRLPLPIACAEEMSKVTLEEGKEAAAKMQCHDYFECTSLGSCEGMDDFLDYITQSGVSLQKTRDKKMARYRFENTVDKGVTKIAHSVRSLLALQGNTAHI